MGHQKEQLQYNASVIQSYWETVCCEFRGVVCAGKSQPGLSIQSHDLQQEVILAMSTVTQLAPWLDNYVGQGLTGGKNPHLDSNIYIWSQDDKVFWIQYNFTCAENCLNYFNIILQRPISHACFQGHRRTKIKILIFTQKLQS